MRIMARNWWGMGKPPPDIDIDAHRRRLCDFIWLAQAAQFCNLVSWPRLGIANIFLVLVFF